MQISNNEMIGHCMCMSDFEYAREPLFCARLPHETALVLDIAIDI